MFTLQEQRDSARLYRFEAAGTVSPVIAEAAGRQGVVSPTHPARSREALGESLLIVGRIPRSSLPPTRRPSVARPERVTVLSRPPGTGKSSSRFRGSSLVSVSVIRPQNGGSRNLVLIELVSGLGTPADQLVRRTSPSRGAG